MDQVRAVADALSRHRVTYRIAGVAALDDFPRVLAASAEPVVFNLVESLDAATGDAMLVPAVCSAFGKSATGNDTPCMTLGIDKWRTKSVLLAAGIPTPPGWLVPIGARLSAAGLLPGPYIVKPLRADASEGIDATSVVPKAGPRLQRAIARVHTEFRQPALGECFFGCREFNVGIVELKGRVAMLPIAEIDFSAFGPDRPRIVDYAAKWLPGTFEFDHTPRVRPKALPARLARQVERSCLAAWNVLGCRDYARADIRVDEDNRIAILEINPNPDITPCAGFSCGLRDAGIRHDRFVLGMVENAVRRLPPARHPRARQRAVRGTPGVVRPTRIGDREEILSFVKATRFFRPNELEIADEVLTDAIAKGDESHYESYAVELDRKPAAWIAFGPTPCTIGTYDIYWIAVAPECQRLGFGRRLLAHAEDRIRRLGGRMVIIETSGRPIYEPTRGFYFKCGYRESGRIRDFYAPGDDKVIFSKPVWPVPGQAPDVAPDRGT